LIDHEDNEMMVKMYVRSPGCQKLAYDTCDAALATPCCYPEQQCRRHATSPACSTNGTHAELYRCIPKDQPRHMVM
jgi:hypothetical protein